jgi:lyso-ornithine lipid O-acyltransferase
MPMPERRALAGVGRLWRTSCFSVAQVLATPAEAAPRARAVRLTVIANQLLREFGLTIEVSGPVPRGPCVLVANHLSWFDPLVVASHVPLAAIAKSEVAKWPLIGERARALGAIFVERSSGHSGARALLEARRALRDGVSVLNFPEGTTTRGDRVLPFRRAIFGLARLLDVPVIPVRLDVDPSLTWVGDDPLLPNLWRVASDARPLVHLRFGEPVPSLPNEFDAARAERVRRRIARHLEPEGASDAALCA